MKQIIILTVLFLTFLNCKAQSPILNMEIDAEIDAPDNSYYKDVNNVLNDFEGTWLYTNNNTSLKITLVKSTMHFNGKYYEDTIIGGYQYIENGVEVVNTLSDANNPSLGISASIDGNLIFNDCTFLPVDDCTDGEKRLGLSIDDPNSDNHYGDLIVHKRAVNDQEAIKIRIEMTYSSGLDPIDGEFPPPSIPWQMHNIVLIKQ